MARFYFDTSDNGQVTRDEIGVELTDAEEARQQALKSLADVAVDELPDGDHREFAIEVRRDDQAVLRATMTVHVERLG